MKAKIKQEKGITMMALVMTVIMLLILTGTMIYNTQSIININKITNLYNDIELLRDKISTKKENIWSTRTIILRTVTGNTKTIKTKIKKEKLLEKQIKK